MAFFYVSERLCGRGRFTTRRLLNIIIIIGKIVVNAVNEAVIKVHGGW